MSKEAMKLALEALNAATRYGAGGFEDAKDALREALAKPDFWEGYVPEPVKPAPPECQTEAEKTAYAFGWWKALESQRALDKKAENARELGLDYEPTQQEPVTFLDWYDNAHWGNEDFKDGCWRAWDAALAQRPWVGLTKEDKWEIVQATERDDRGYVMALVEAKLRSKNEDRN